MMEFNIKNCGKTTSETIIEFNGLFVSATTFYED